ncbi:hypothetical protein G6O69_13220 [Pseudenhygromyxa sp. WMMC2535]|uniref:hypothetical protein n=1 Tax=Pseudenhygromyxa sp. WMMC2535 TaxID=2712867 RepID=UPI0015564071|nr:hypothetical protein [Pseudenhygromyxa sp. WMMC2535]NVB38795.1 hypothetical protein [Pseudenhygromyxa sp. WMMC2535]
MSSSETSHEQVVFRDWLRRGQLTGCAFAAHFAASEEGLLFYELFDSAVDPAAVADFLDEAGQSGRVGVLLGVNLRGDDETASFLGALSSHPRWEISADPQLARDGREVGVRSTWTTSEGLRTDAMGFAPSAFMPVSRRAPYLALAAWTGGHANAQLERPKHGEVGMGDAPPPRDVDYEKSMDLTHRWSKRVREPSEIGHKLLRRLSFRLDKAAVERSFPTLLGGL